MKLENQTRDLKQRTNRVQDVSIQITDRVKNNVRKESYENDYVEWICVKIVIIVLLLSGMVYLECARVTLYMIKFSIMQLSDFAV